MSVGRSGVVQPGNYIICTSSTRPGSPYTGLMIYETDTDEFLIYDGSNWLNMGTGDMDNILAWTGL